jgi:hypothetical protein
VDARELADFKSVVFERFRLSRQLAAKKSASTP